jgi:serine/threonine-protein kinase
MPGSAVSDLAGRVLAGRYLLHGAIGTGASGRVYVAEDTRLRRRVAVKVLHAALAEDASFLRRFRAEAQLAASLQHPHIVTVHDWGEDDVPFMVLELLEGGSLRAMLDDGTRLTVSQAARIGRDVASALDYAHARGVLHRDIKPANLLFDEHGIVRVADFGLARALAEASWTEPAGALFGTARYASPEQAQGVKLDGRSDLYSLGLVLVEAVTGTLPFTADTTIGLLTARTQAPLVAPGELGPLAPVVDRVGAVDPHERYPDAATMRAALRDAADALPPPAPLVLAGMIDRVDPHPTRAVAPNRAPLFDQDAPDEPEPTVEVVTALAAGGTDARRQRRLVPFVVGLVLLVTVAIAAAALAQIGGAATISVGNYVGLVERDAVAAAQRDGFEARIADRRPHPDPPGTVIEQSPRAGALTSGRRITFVVSTGPPDVAVPAIVGRRWAEEAEPTLKGGGWLYETKEAYHDTQPAGVVLEVNPAPGTSVPPDTKLVVTVSKGHAPVDVPDVSTRPYDEAVEALEAAGFSVTRGPDEFSSTVDKGDVVRTDPAAGTPAPYGGTITVHVSKGPDLVTVPDLTNLSIEEAQAALDEAGLRLAVSGSVRRNEVVVDQDPSRGERVPRDSTVTVRFGRRSFICGVIDC